MRFFQQYKILPSIFQRQLLGHVIACVCLTILTGVFVWLRFELAMFFPGLICIAFLLLHGIWLFRLATTQRYIVVEGTCTSIYRTPIRKRVRYLQLDVQGMCVQIASKRSYSSYYPQQPLRLYLALQTPVHEKDGIQIIQDYLGIEALPRSSHH